MKNLSLLVALLFILAPLAFAEPPDTISTGKIYAYGHELDPPYVLEIVDNSLQVNGVQVFPDLAQVASTRSKHEIGERPEPYKSVFALQRELENQKLPVGEITNRMASFMREQEDVDSVTEVASAAFWVWSGGAREQFTISRRALPTMEERCLDELAHWDNLLASNAIIIVGGVICPGNRPGTANQLDMEIEQARNATEESLENWNGVILSADIARQFHEPWSLIKD